MTNSLLCAVDITKTYPQGSPQGSEELQILKGISLDIQEGDDLCIVGSSGAGKSTLLHILGTLDRPSSGKLEYQGRDLLAFGDEELSLFRNQKMGFVFQFHHLLAEFTALENVMIPGRIGGESRVHARVQAEHLLEQMGLSHRMNHYPSELSGGELQRVAIARALVRKPQVLFADEPTGNLDSANSQIIQDLFFHLKKVFGLTLIVVTHDAGFARKFGKIMRMTDGRWNSQTIDIPRSSC